MPVDTKHPDYVRWADRWAKCRDAAGGEEAIKAKQEVYLPRLSGHVANGSAYQEYTNYAWYFNALGRTIDGFLGLLFARSPVITAPTALDGFLLDCDGAGTSFEEFIRQAAYEVLLLNRCGGFVDYPEKNPNLRSRADLEKAGRRPFLTLYPAEEIVNWSPRREGAELFMDRVVLFESEAVEGDDEFADDAVDQYKVLELDEVGLYRQRKFRAAAKPADEVANTPVDQRGPGETATSATSFEEDDALTVEPKQGGSRMGEVPFVIFSAKGDVSGVERPLLLDLINVNLAWYRNCAVLEHGLLWAGNPTPWIAGYNKKAGEVIPLGGSEVLVIPDSAGKAGYMEITGQALVRIQEAMDRKRQDMAALGARILSEEKRAAETAEAHEIKRQGETSILSYLAVAISRQATRLLKHAARWTPGSEKADVRVEINRRFFTKPMDPQLLTALVAAWQAGAFPHEDLHRTLVSADLIDAARDSKKVLSEAQKERAESPEAELDDETKAAFDNLGGEGETEE